MAFNPRSFQHHPPTGNQAERYARLRDEGRDLALTINVICPESREKALAMTNLEQALMWANKAIAVNDPEA